MRRLFTLLVLVAVAMPVTAAPAATRTVKVTASGFSPRSLTVSLGDRVTWQNTDTHSHQVVADNGAFASPILRAGKTYSHVFHAAGRFAYHDALHPGRRGTIVVKGPPPSVSLALSVPIVKYGATTTLTVQISVKRAGEAVAIEQTPWGGATTTAATLATDANGTATVTLTPQQYTTYVAKWKSATSGSVVAQVRPKLTFLPYGDGRFVTRVLGPRSFAGRHVYVQRLSRFGQWVTVSVWKLGPKSGRVFPLPRLRGRWTYRVYMTVNQAGIALLDGWSGTQTLRRR